MPSAQPPYPLAIENAAPSPSFFEGTSEGYGSTVGAYDLTRLTSDRLHLLPEDFQRQASLESLWHSLGEIANLGQDWDGFGASPIPTQAVNTAKAFIRHLPADMPIPHATAGSYGDVVLYWKSATRYVEVGIAGDGTYYFFAETPIGKFGQSNLTLARLELPEDLRSALLLV